MLPPPNPSAPRAPRALPAHLSRTDAPVVVKGTLDVGAAIVLTAGLSFIGLGAVPPTAEWGAMINQGSRQGSSIGGFRLFRDRHYECRHGTELLRRRPARRSRPATSRPVSESRERALAIPAHRSDRRNAGDLPSRTWRRCRVVFARRSHADRPPRRGGDWRRRRPDHQVAPLPRQPGRLRPGHRLRHGTDRPFAPRHRNRFGPATRLADQATVLAVTGFPAGGVSPVAHATPIRVVIDRRAAALDVVYGGGGAEDVLLRIRPRDIMRLTSAEVADIALAE